MNHFICAFETWLTLFLYHTEEFVDQFSCFLHVLKSPTYWKILLKLLFISSHQGLAFFLQLLEPGRYIWLLKALYGLLMLLPQVCACWVSTLLIVVEASTTFGSRLAAKSFTYTDNSIIHICCVKKDFFWSLFLSYIISYLVTLLVSSFALVSHNHTVYSHFVSEEVQGFVTCYCILNTYYRSQAPKTVFLHPS